MMFVLVY